ncbi:hypothetical protein BH10PAT4_BH10PAT4_5190 [soil metagenome]
MQTKPLLYGLIGFFIGGLLVSIAATTFNKPDQNPSSNTNSSMSSMSMDNLTAELNGKTGEAFDKAFIANMIAHHEGAVEMAKLSAANAKHDEIKNLSEDIIAAQEKEISEMKQWQIDWGYSTATDHTSTQH